LRNLQTNSTALTTSTSAAHNQSSFNMIGTYNITFDPSVIPILNTEDEVKFKKYFEGIRTQTATTTNFMATKLNSTSKLVNFTSSNMQVMIVQVNNTFNFTDFFKYNIQNYYPYVNMQDCITYIMTKVYKKTKYSVIMSYINWISSPLIYNNSLYQSNTSPEFDLKLFDIDTKEEIQITDCSKYPIQLFNPITNQNLPPALNKYKTQLDPTKRILYTDPMFNSRVYTYPNGTISNSTVEERRNDNFFMMNFTCDHLTDKNGIYSYTSDGCTYVNFTSNYFLCECSKLNAVNIVNFSFIQFAFYLGDRFEFFLNYRLLLNIENFISNYAFYASLFILFIYFSIIILFSCCDCYYNRESGKISWLEKQIIKLALPYSKHYNFTSTLDFVKDENAGGFTNLDREEHRSKFEKKIPQSMNVEVIEVDKLTRKEKINAAIGDEKKPKPEINDLIEMDADLMDFDQIDYNIIKKDYLKPNKKESEEVLEVLAGQELENNDILTLGQNKSKKHKKHKKKSKLFDDDDDNDDDNEKVKEKKPKDDDDISIKTNSASERINFNKMYQSKKKKADDNLYEINERVEENKESEEVQQNTENNNGIYLIN